MGTKGGDILGRIQWSSVAHGERLPKMKTDKCPLELSKGRSSVMLTSDISMEYRLSQAQVKQVRVNGKLSTGRMYKHH